MINYMKELERQFSVFHKYYEKLDYSLPPKEDLAKNKQQDKDILQDTPKKRKKNGITQIYPPRHEVKTMIKTGKRFICKRGYVYIKYKHYKTYLHRLVVMDANISIPSGYTIHHKDFNKLNNNIDNLEVLNWAEHRKLHWKR